MYGIQQKIISHILCLYAYNVCTYICESRKQRSLPLVHVFPPHSSVHQYLFLSLNPSPPGATASAPLQLPAPSLFIPANEFLLEAIGHILHQSNSGGVIIKGECFFHY